VVALDAVAFPYQRQIWSFLTHWKGSPRSTEPYVPYPPDQRPELRIAVAGDVGDSGPRIRAVGATVGRLADGDPWDVLLLLGDNVYPTGDPARLPEVVYKPFGPVLDRGTALLAILGNHDVRKGYGDAQMAALGQPGRRWSVERSGVLLVGLDSNRPDDPDQLAWLERTLRDTEAPWKIVALHHPPYSAGYQGSNDATRAAFTPLFERYGVQLVLSGHDHDYQRSRPIGATTYIVTGAAAGTRRTGEAGFTAVSFSWHSYLELGVYPDRIVGRALNQDNRVADEWSLPRDGTPAGR
jgi:hypothetical protein